jgi:hypothetical protein
MLFHSETAYAVAWWRSPQSAQSAAGSSNLWCEAVVGFFGRVFFQWRSALPVSSARFSPPYVAITLTAANIRFTTQVPASSFQ